MTDEFFDPDDLECDFTAKDYAWACAEVRRLNAVIAKLKKIRTKPPRSVESHLEWFDDGWNTCVERIEAALLGGD